MDFVAFDVETANERRIICSLGLVVVKNNKIVDTFYTLINPEQSFSRACVAIHGITKKVVANSPTFPEIWPQIKQYFECYPVVGHNVNFDKSALERAVLRYNLSLAPVVYYDTMTLYQHNYPDAEDAKLESMCAELGVCPNGHHNALADATATAMAMISMVESGSNTISPLVTGKRYEHEEYEYEEESVYNAKEDVPTKEVELAVTTAAMSTVEKIDFYKSIFVITGVVEGYARSEIKNLIERRGGRVAGSVSRKTNYVVAGLQDVSVIKDGENAKSLKILDAERYQKDGCDIKIIDGATLVAAFEENPV